MISNMVTPALTPERTTTMTTDDLPWLDLRDVCRVLGEERERAKQIRAGVPENEVDVSGARPLAEMTVRTYAYRQRRPGERRQYVAMRNEGREFPAPVYSGGRKIPKSGDVPVWPVRAGETREQVEDRFRTWYRLRTGPGQGGGRPRKVQPERKPADQPARRTTRRGRKNDV